MSEKPVIRDDNHFRYLSDEPPAVIPEGVSMQLEFKTAAEMVAERKVWIAGTKTCELCQGKGRVPRRPNVRAHFKYYRAGPTWVLSFGLPTFGLIHLGSPFWWKPILLFPLALWRHSIIALRRP